MNLQLHDNTANASASSAVDAHRPLRADGVINMRAALPMRTEWKVALWNVRTMLSDGAPELVARTLAKRNIKMACLCELRIAGSGRKVIDVPVRDGEEFSIKSYELLYSGPTDGKGQHGVGFMVEKQLSASISSWEPINSRLARVRLQTKPLCMTVIVAYAPTEGSDDAAKEAFYGSLYGTLDKVVKRDYLLIGGDFNAKIGVPASAVERRCAGANALGSRNDNGDRLMELMIANQLLATNTCFDHKAAHTVTWHSNDQRTQNQIDYILVRQRWRSSIMDARTYWGTAWVSDHGLLQARFRLRFSCDKISKRPLRFDTECLQLDDRKAAFQNAVCTNLQRVTGAGASLSIDERWGGMKAALADAAKATIGFAKRRPSQWISAETIQLINERERLDPAKSRQHPIHSQIRAAVRKDKESYWASQAHEMNAASQAGDFGKLFRHIKRLNSSSAAGDVLKDSNGELLSDPEEKASRWREHFCELLNRPAPANPIIDDELPWNGDLDVVSDAPSKQEVEMAIRSMKSGKAAGEDGLPPEFWKCGGESLVDALTDLLNEVWRVGCIPVDWETAVVLPLFKKGDKSVCKNYRGISLLDIALKILEAIVATRLRRPLNEITRENQAGFRPGRGCVDQIFALRQILETRHEYQQPTYVAFVDFAAAFDSVDRSSLWHILECDGIPTQLIRIVKAIYSHTASRVRTGGAMSEDFELVTGVRQGAVLSPLLFTRAIDWVMAGAVDVPGLGLTVGDTRVSDLTFADDIALLSADPVELQTMLNNIQLLAARVGLLISSEKTKVMCSLPTQPCQFYVNGQALKQVRSFKYLGSEIAENGDAGCEARARRMKGQAAFSALSRLWNDRNVTVATKMKVYMACVRPVLVYGCETWPLKAEHLKMLTAFEHRCWRRILHIPYTAHITNEVVRERVSVANTIDALIKHKRLTWFGHVARMDMARPPKATLFTPVPAQWKRRPGGQRKNWRKCLQNDLDWIKGPYNVDHKHWSNNGWLMFCAELAQDRRGFSRIISNCC